MSEASNSPADSSLNESSHGSSPDSASENASAPSLTPEQVAALENEVKEKEKKYVYLYAEFENWKKRAVKERQDAAKYGWEPVARDLLQVLDNIDRAIQHAPQSTDKTFLEGLQMIRQQFHNSLEKQGARPIDSLNQPFDPNLHDALGKIPSDLPEGTVAHEETKGYFLHDRLLRPARVFVSQGKS